ncbi:MAG TPA: hypothetical protein VEW25_00550 [Allosphingosinicella sp.]|nr:hypothetical protein [Allosphingosinicella sp.]
MRSPASVEAFPPGPPQRFGLAGDTAAEPHLNWLFILLVMIARISFLLTPKSASAEGSTDA